MRNTWLWNRFDGLNDTNYEGLGNLFGNDSYNIDVRTAPGGVRLAAAQVTSLTPDAIPRTILLNGNSLLAFTDNGKLYAGSATPAHTIAATNKVTYSATFFTVSGTEYVFFCTADRLMQGTTALGSINESYQTLTSTTSHPMIVARDCLYVGDKNSIKKLTSAGVWSTEITFPANQVIIGFTEYQDQLKIYTNVIEGGENIHGIQYIWDFVDSYDYAIKWDNMPFLGVTNVGSSDYVITGPSYQVSDLYVSSGSQRQLLKSNSEYDTSARTFNNAIISRFDDVYIGGAYGTTGMVYKYGKYYPSNSNSLTPDYQIGANYTVYSIDANTSGIYAGVSNGSTHKVVFYSFNTNPEYATSGEITTGVFEGSAVFVKKSLVTVELGSDGGLGVIKTYFSKDRGANWTLIDTWTNSTGEKRRRIDTPILASAALGDINDLRMKVRIERNSASIAPMFRGALITYDDNISR